jgi:hypothetical protein
MGITFGDPFWRLLQNQSKSPGFPGCFVFSMTFTKQVLFGLAKNKTTTP